MSDPDQKPRRFARRTESPKQQRSRLARRSFPPNPRPLTRADCIDAQRPCPYVGCKYHLFLDVTDAYGLKFNFPLTHILELSPSCSLDVADDGAHTLEEIGTIYAITRERARQIEARALAKLALAIDQDGGANRPLSERCETCVWFPRCHRDHGTPAIALYCVYKPSRYFRAQ